MSSLQQTPMSSKCHFLATDSSYQFLVRWDASLRATVGQMLKCRWCLCCSLSAVCIPSSQYEVLDIIAFVTLFFGGICTPITTVGLLFHSSGCYHFHDGMSGIFGSGCTAKK